MGNTYKLYIHATPSFVREGCLEMKDVICCSTLLLAALENKDNFSSGVMCSHAASIAAMPTSP